MWNRLQWVELNVPHCVLFINSFPFFFTFGFMATEMPPHMFSFPHGNLKFQLNLSHTPLMTNASFSFLSFSFFYFILFILISFFFAVAATATALELSNEYSKSLTCNIVGCWIWWPLTNVSASAWSGVTVQTPSSNEIKQCRGWIDGPNNCSWFVFAEPTY